MLLVELSSQINREMIIIIKRYLTKNHNFINILIISDLNWQFVCYKKNAISYFKIHIFQILCTQIANLGQILSKY